MTTRRAILALVLPAAFLLAAQSAGAATTLGSPDAGAQPDTYACALAGKIANPR